MVFFIVGDEIVSVLNHVHTDVHVLILIRLEVLTVYFFHCMAHYGRVIEVSETAHYFKR